MEKVYINFDTVKVFVNWLIDNEGVELCDLYGRVWKYEYFSFFFKDLGENLFEEKMSCMHLYGTDMFYYSKK